MLPSLMQVPDYCAGLLLSLLCTGVVPAQLFVFTFAWQLGAGLSATQMSLLCMPIPLGVILGVTSLGKLAFARSGAHCIALGLAIQLAGIALMATLDSGVLGVPVQQVMASPGLLAQGLLGPGVGFSRLPQSRRRRRRAVRQVAPRVRSLQAESLRRWLPSRWWLPWCREAI